MQEPRRQVAAQQEVEVLEGEAAPEDRGRERLLGAPRLFVLKWSHHGKSNPYIIVSPEPRLRNELSRARGERRRQHRRHREVDDEQERHQARVAAHGGDALGEGILRGQSVWHLHPSTACSSSRFWSQSIQRAPHLVAARRAVPFSSIQGCWRDRRRARACGRDRSPRAPPLVRRDSGSASSGTGRPSLELARAVGELDEDLDRHAHVAQPLHRDLGVERHVFALSSRFGGIGTVGSGAPTSANPSSCAAGRVLRAHRVVAAASCENQVSVEVPAVVRPVTSLTVAMKSSVVGCAKR